MLSDHTRIILFILLCIPARLGLAYLTTITKQKKQVYILSAILALIGLGFISLWVTNSRLKSNEGGGTTWWHEFRIIHGMLYLTSAILLLKYPDIVYIPILIEVFLGIILFFTIRK